MGKIETQLMRSKWGQIINSTVVNQVESELDTLKGKAVSVAIVGDVTTVKNTVNIVEKMVNVAESRVIVLEQGPNLRFLPTVMPSAHFVGRTKELRQFQKYSKNMGAQL